MKVLFASAELAPLARVGGLAEAAGGLVAALRAAAIDVTVLLPDYGGVVLKREKRAPLETPAWTGPMWTRAGTHPTVGQVTLVGSAELARPNPYVDATGIGWLDNDLRFMQFSAGIATIRDETRPDVVHLNDWHAAAASALGATPRPTVLTIHTLGYQGVSPPHWLGRLARRSEDFEWWGQTNPLAGGIRLADRVIAVSPNYVTEMLREDSGMGLHEILSAKGPSLVGILNGIDATEWNPQTDPHLASTFSLAALEARAQCRRDLMDTAQWADSKEPIIGVVSRLVDQKGIDLLLDTVRFLERMPAKLFVLGSGLPGLASALHHAAAAFPERVYFHDGYDLALAHRIFAGSDLFAMPSRFEPCGLAQMQAMRYGSIPVVTPVGGLVDTVIDADGSRAGTGFVSRTVDSAGMVDALHRAVRAYKNGRRRQGIQKRGMQHDWSWQEPAERHIELYRDLAEKP
ncbi:MAG: glycosyltransferase [bacterium]|nr:glycosyltransferase [bacterium]